jgi:hypothetical protein
MWRQQGRWSRTERDRRGVPVQSRWLRSGVREVPGQHVRLERRRNLLGEGVVARWQTAVVEGQSERCNPPDVEVVEVIRLDAGPVVYRHRRHLPPRLYPPREGRPKVGRRHAGHRFFRGGWRYGDILSSSFRRARDSSASSLSRLGGLTLLPLDESASGGHLPIASRGALRARGASRGSREDPAAAPLVGRLDDGLRGQREKRHQGETGSGMDARKRCLPGAHCSPVTVPSRTQSSSRPGQDSQRRRPVATRG